MATRAALLLMMVKNFEMNKWLNRLADHISYYRLDKTNFRKTSGLSLESPEKWKAQVTIWYFSQAQALPRLTLSAKAWNWNKWAQLTWRGEVERAWARAWRPGVKFVVNKPQSWGSTRLPGPPMKSRQIFKIVFFRHAYRYLAEIWYRCRLNL